MGAGGRGRRQRAAADENLQKSCGCLVERRESQKGRDLALFKGLPGAASVETSPGLCACLLASTFTHGLFGLARSAKR